MNDLRTAILKMRDGYQSQMKFCDIEPLGYFREFVRYLDEALARDSDGPRMAETNEDSSRGEAGPARAEGIAHD